MGVQLKIDDQSLPGIARWLMGGGLTDDGSGDANTAGSSFIGNDENPLDPVTLHTKPQPQGDTSINPGPGEVLPPAKTKLNALHEMMQRANIPAVPQPQPNFSAGQSPAALPPSDLADSVAAGTAKIKPTFAEAHPTLLKLLRGGLMLGESAAAGSGAPSFGEGFERAKMLPIQMMLQRANLAKTGAEIANQSAQARYHAAQAGSLENTVPVTVQGPNGEPITYHVPESQVKSVLKLNGPGQGKQTIIRNPVTGMIEGVQTADGKVISPNSPDFPAEVKAIIGNETPKTKPVTPEEDKLRTRQLEKSLDAGTISDTDRQDLVGRQQEEKIQGVGSEIVAQVGKPPVPAQFAKGQNDPEYKRLNKAWGQQVETVKNREAAASGAARGAAYNQFRPVQVIDPKTGEVKYMYAGEAIGGGAAPAAEGTKIMSKKAQFAEMHTAADKARDAINNLDKDFTPTQIAKLSLAFSHNDPTVVNNEIDTIFGTQQLTPAQQDFVIWLNQLNERAMSLRNVAGMGQGAADLRAAIQNTLPGLRSGSKQMALKQLDAFKNQLNLLEKGVPGVKTPQTNNTPPASDLSKKYPGFVPD